MKKIIISISIIFSFHYAASETPTSIQAWNSLCDSLGAEVEAVYTYKGETKRVKAVVGDLNSRCRGRCGSGCGSKLFKSDGYGAYTQECLNHDMCHTIEGEQLGDCADEMKRAADGFLRAPKCSITGKLGL